ncbi:DUF1573 domain-containing protein [Planctomycetota bacterium]
MVKKCVFLLALAIPAGVIARYLQNDDSPVVLSPHTLVIEEPSCERDVLKAEFKLRNTSDNELRISGINTSCGCLSVVTKGGESLQEGTVVPGGSNIDIEVAIDTSTSSGQLGQSFFIDAEIKGDPIDPLVGNVEYFVLPGLRLDPAVLEVKPSPDGTQATGVVSILDGFVDPGVEVTVANISGPIEIWPVKPQNKTLIVEELRFSVRQSFKVSVPLNAEHREGAVGMIIFESDHENWQSVTLPVILNSDVR